MTSTTIDINNPLAMSAWSKKLMTEITSATPISPLIGKNRNSIIQMKEELKKGQGDRIIFALRAQLIGEGVSYDKKLEGNEEALSTLHDSVYINELAHAVRVRHEGTIDQQRVPFDLRAEAQDSLVDWYANRLSIMTFLHFCGYNAPNLNTDHGQIKLSPTYWGFNEPTFPSENRIIRPQNKLKDSDLDEKDTFDLRFIDRAVEKAKLASPKIRPIRVGGENLYVMYLHPTQVTALRTNTESGQWLDIQKSAYTGSRKENPIFDGSLGMYNGVILRESEHITQGVDNMKIVPNVRRAVFLGAQAGVIAFGKEGGPTRYKLVEEVFDYQRELGIAAKTLLGFKKTTYHSQSARQKNEDFGVIVIPTYAKSN